MHVVSLIPYSEITEQENEARVLTTTGADETDTNVLVA